MADHLTPEGVMAIGMGAILNDANASSYLGNTSRILLASITECADVMQGHSRSVSDHISLACAAALRHNVRKGRAAGFGDSQSDVVGEAGSGREYFFDAVSSFSRFVSHGDGKHV